MKRAHRVGWVSDSATKAYLGTLNFSNANGMSWGLTGNTLTAAFALAAAVSNFQIAPAGAASSLQQANNRVTIRRFEINRPVSLSRLDVPFVWALTSTADAAVCGIAFTSGAQILTRTGSTLSPIVGATGSTTHSWASDSANFSSVSGGRLASFPIATVLMPGEYYLALQLSTTQSSMGTSTSSAANAISMQVGSTNTASGAFQDFGALTNLSTTGFVPFQGLVSVSLSATNQTWQLSQVSQSGTAGIAANIWFAGRNV